MDTAFYLNHLSSFRGTLYCTAAEVANAQVRLQELRQKKSDLEKQFPQLAIRVHFHTFTFQQPPPPKKPLTDREKVGFIVYIQFKGFKVRFGASSAPVQRLKTFVGLYEDIVAFGAYQVENLYEAKKLEGELKKKFKSYISPEDEHIFRLFKELVRLLVETLHFHANNCSTNP